MSIVYTPPPDSPLHCHYRDPYLLAVEKPAGLLSVPGRGPERSDCLLGRVQRGFPGALVVHRLDMGTSGLMLFALDRPTQGALGKLFQQRRVSKRYLACVRGVPDPASGAIDLPLLDDWVRRPRKAVDLVNGRAAHTDYRTLRRSADGDRSWLELAPTTGRSHQLRVHLAAIGHPILGDELYADAATLALAPRLLLHAEALEFDHPVTGERLQLHSPAPF